MPTDETRDDLATGMEEEYEVTALPDDFMEMRDWFAGLALQEILDANDDDLEDMDDIRSKSMKWARAAYVIADAMIEAREGLVESDDDEDDDL